MWSVVQREREVLATCMLIQKRVGKAIESG